MRTASYFLAWDVPTRLAHWSIVAFSVLLWWTGSRGLWITHIVAGEALIAVIVFRFLWTFAGGSTARLWASLKGYRKVATYARGILSRERDWHNLGHNPLGAWSALSMFMVLTTVALSGACAETIDGLAEGPLAAWIPQSQADVVTLVHERCWQILVALVGLHVSAVMFYVIFKRQNLLSAMIHGKRLLPQGTYPFESAPPSRAVVVILISAAAAALLLFLSVRSHGLAGL